LGLPGAAARFELRISVIMRTYMDASRLTSAIGVVW
jgi:hypothetical protein